MDCIMHSLLKEHSHNGLRASSEPPTRLSISVCGRAMKMALIGVATLCLLNTPHDVPLSLSLMLMLLCVRVGILTA